MKDTGLNDYINKIHCLDWSQNKLPSKCASLIIADPPYFQVKGEFDFTWNSFNDYLKDVEKWVIECKRILADNGTLIWWGDSKNIAYTQVIIDKYFDLINSAVWENTNQQKQQIKYSKAARCFATLTERFLVYVNDLAEKNNSIFKVRDYIRDEIIKAEGAINLRGINSILGSATNGGGVASACLSLNKSEPALLTSENYKKLQNHYKPHLQTPYQELKRQFEDKRRPFKNIHNLGDVIRLPNLETTKFDHETIKPEKITRYFIQTCSRPGDLVVVPFAGSGTECAMSAKEGRRFVGYDIEQKHVNTSNKRSAIHLGTLSLF